MSKLIFCFSPRIHCKNTKLVFAPTKGQGWIFFPLVKWKNIWSSLAQSVENTTVSSVYWTNTNFCCGNKKCKIRPNRRERVCWILRRFNTTIDMASVKPTVSASFVFTFPRLHLRFAKLNCRSTSIRSFWSKWVCRLSRCSSLLGLPNAGPLSRIPCSLQ